MLNSASVVVVEPGGADPLRVAGDGRPVVHAHSHCEYGWEPDTSTSIGDPLTGHTGWVKAVAAVPLPDGRTLLATGGSDETVRLWDPATGTPVRDPLTGHTDWVWAVAAVPLPDGRTLLATGSRDETVRLWDPAIGAGLKRLAVDTVVRALSPLGVGRLAVALDDGASLA